jgi:hypothetical protein
MHITLWLQKRWAFCEQLQETCTYLAYAPLFLSVWQASILDIPESLDEDMHTPMRCTVLGYAVQELPASVSLIAHFKARFLGYCS